MVMEKLDNALAHCNKLKKFFKCVVDWVRSRLCVSGFLCLCGTKDILDKQIETMRKQVLAWK